MIEKWINWRKKVGRFAALVRIEVKSPVPIGLSKRLYYWRRGFLGERALIYPRSRLHLYVSDVDHEFRAHGVNGPLRAILSDKLLFSLMLMDSGLVPEVLGLIDMHGEFVALGPKAGVTLEHLLEGIGPDSGIVLRSVGGYGGGGVQVVRRAGSGVSVNEADPISPNRIAASLQRPTGTTTIITKYVKQHAYSAEIFSRSVNTIRLLTMIRPGTNEPFIARAIHRFGTDRSVPVDNWTQGGLTAPVDLRSGTLGPAVNNYRQAPIAFFDRHPDTNALITGKVIPRWDEVKRVVLNLAERFAFLPYIGWDVVVGTDQCWVLEGNNHPGVTLLQLHGPLLTDPDVRAFYEHYGVVRRRAAVGALNGNVLSK